MKVETIIKKADSLVGQTVDIEGYIIIIERAKRKIAFVSSSAEISEKAQKQIFIDHTLAELKTIIRPLPSMQLLFRGVLTNPPYFYRFQTNFRATLDMDADNKPVLKDISEISIRVPYTGKMAELTVHDSYDYSAQVDYKPVAVDGKRTARAVVSSQKTILLVEKEADSESISPDENRYARRIANQMVRLSGWLETAPSKNGIINHMLFMTTSIRASMVAVGPLREETVIWLRPSSLDKLLKAHMPHSVESSLNQAVEIVGQVDYIHEHDIPMIGEKSPKLVFKDIQSLIIHEKNYLW